MLVIFHTIGLIEREKTILKSHSGNKALNLIINLNVGIGLVKRKFLQES